MSRYKVGAGSSCQAGLQSSFGTSVSPEYLVNMTSESLSVNVNKGDEGNLLASKTANQRDTISIGVEGGISTVLRPEFVDWALEATMGVENDGVYTLADPNDDLPVSTVVLRRGDIVKTYPDLTVRSLTLSAAAQDYVKADFDFIGTKELSVGDSGAQTIQNISYSLPSYRCSHAKLIYGAGGTGLTITDWDACQVNALDIESCTITIDNGIEEAPATYCAGLYNGQPVKGLRSVNVEFSIPYSSSMDDFRKAYYVSENAPYVALKLGFTTNDTNESIEVYLPYVSITASNNPVGGSGIIEASFTGEALSIGSAEPITITVNHAE